MLRKPEDKKDWQKDILPSIEETSDPLIVEVNGEAVAETVLKTVLNEEAPKNMPKKPVAKKTSAKKATKKPIAKMEV